MAKRRQHSSRQYSSGNLAEPGDLVSPTPERHAHGLVERLDRPIADGAGAVARPYRNVDLLATMLRRGSITDAMQGAGDNFRRDFTLAHFEPLRACDLFRTSSGSHRSPALAGLDARDAVWRALLALGGLDSAAGSCVWGVLGNELTLKAWALSQGWNGRRVSQEAASGILIAALGMLEAHYQRRRDVQPRDDAPGWMPPNLCGAAAAAP